jgi:phosphatidylinositol alpha-1,6-mannosyltransferase
LPHIDLRQYSANTDSGSGAPKSPNGNESHLSDNPRITFLIRKNSNTIGGIQSYNNRLYAALSSRFNIEKISWNGPEWGVPFYFPQFYYRAVRNGTELVYCDDAVTALVGPGIRNQSGKKIVATVHGLDIILPIPWYQKRLAKTFPVIDKIICLSKATAQKVRDRGGKPEQIEIIPGSIEKDPIRFPRSDELYDNIQSFLGIKLKGKKVLISVGRCVKRKGFDKFISNAFKNLPDDYIYIVISPKPSTPTWIRALRPILGYELYHNLLLASGAYTMHDDLVRFSGNNSRVFYLNNVSEERRNMLLSVSDLFIMPNRTIEGDMEGFGLVALEAASRGVPVIASGIEGIPDAVINGQNGYCVPEDNYGAMLNLITGIMGDPCRLRELSHRAEQFTCDNFSHDKIFGRHKRLFESLLANGGYSK